MIYQRNVAMEYTELDESCVVVFDSETHYTHMLDNESSDIIRLLKEPHKLETIVLKISEIYEASTETLKTDIEEFINELIEKRVVLVV